MSNFTDKQLALITPDLNMRRYIGSEQIDIFKEGECATLVFPTGYGHGPRTHKLCVTLCASETILVKVKEDKMRIRKLIPLECLKLMGFTEDDYQAMRNIGMTDSQIYHCAGDSIVVSVLMGLFGQLLPITETNLQKQIIDYTDSLVVGGD